MRKTLAITPAQLAMVQQAEPWIHGALQRNGAIPGDREDLAQICRIELCVAAAAYDPTKSAWRTWAGMAIRRAIHGAWAHQGASCRGGGFGRKDKLRARAEHVSLDSEGGVGRKLRNPEPDWTPPMNVDSVIAAAVLSDTARRSLNERLAGATYDEIALLTGQTRSAVASCLWRSKRVLRDTWSRIEAAA